MEQRERNLNLADGYKMGVNCNDGECNDMAEKNYLIERQHMRN